MHGVHILVCVCVRVLGQYMVKTKISMANSGHSIMSYHTQKQESTTIFYKSETNTSIYPNRHAKHIYPFICKLQSSVISLSKVIASRFCDARARIPNPINMCCIIMLKTKTYRSSCGAHCLTTTSTNGGSGGVQSSRISANLVRSLHTTRSDIPV